MGKTLSALVLAIALATSGCGSGSSKESEESPTSPSLLTPDDTEDTTPDFVDQQVTDVGDSPSELVFAAGSVWVVSHRDATISRLDPGTGKVQATVKSPGVDLIGIAASAGHVWFLDGGKQRIEAVNTSTNRIDVSVRVGSDGGGLAPASDGIWFGGVHGTVMHIDRSGRIVDTVKVGRPQSGLSPWVVGDRVAVADANTGDVTMLDGRDGTTVGTVHVGGDPGVLATDGGDLWVGDFSGPLFELDHSAAKVARTVKLPAVDHMVSCAGRLWVRVNDRVIEGIDPQSGKVVKKYGGLPVSEIPGGGITCADGALWEANWSYGSVWRIPLS